MNFLLNHPGVESDSMLDVLTVDTSSLMETGYSLLMDARSAVNAKKLLASTDFQIHVQSITGFTSESLEPQAATMVILQFILFLEFVCSMFRFDLVSIYDE